MEHYNSSDDYNLNSDTEIDYLNELFNAGAETEKNPVTPSSLRKLALGSLLAVYGSGEVKRSSKLNALMWTKTNTDPDNYESASYIVRHDRDIDIWSYKYRQINSNIMDNETGWASSVSEYKFMWDNNAVIEASSVERFVPSHTIEDVESISNAISLNFADVDQLGEDLYEKLEAARDETLITPYAENLSVSQDEVNDIMSRIIRISGAETVKWKDYGDNMNDLLYRRMGRLVDETIANSNRGDVDKTL